MVKLDINRLDSYLGKYTVMQQHRWQVVDVMLTPPTLILQQQDSLGEIQNNQHGEARRRVPMLESITVYAADGKSLNPHFSKLQFSDHGTI